MKNFIVSPENPNGKLVDFTAEEIAENDALQQTLDSEQAARETEAQAKADLKASAKAKLIAGEALTAEEADTIVI
jgi:hypothetical protein|tara:strand:- start:31 stop:255 length:225 start_codon:yes stop_codon:yes gene_type:complete